MGLAHAGKATLARNVNLNAIAMTKVNVTKTLENATTGCVPMDGVEATANKVCIAPHTFQGEDYYLKIII